MDPVAGHVEQAAGLGLASALVGDARELPFEDERFDAVLLLGPLYHLTSAPTASPRWPRRAAWSSRAGSWPRR